MSDLNGHSAHEPAPAGLSPSKDCLPSDCTTLIDECLTREDWWKIFNFLFESQTVSAKSLLMRFRFLLPHPDPVQLPPMLISSRVAPPAEVEDDDDLEPAPWTADEILQQPGR